MLADASGVILGCPAVRVSAALQEIRNENKGTRMDATQPTLVAEDVHKNFGTLEVLKGISLTANKGDVVSIIGSSGSGKEYFPSLYEFPRNAE